MFEAFKTPVAAVRNPYGPSRNPYDRDPLDDLPGVMVTGPFTEKVRARLTKLRPEALYLNGSRGWRCDDYGFLGELPGLQLLSVVAAQPTAPFPIAAIAGLRALHLDCALPQVTDLASLPALRSCALTWSAAAKSLFGCRDLERLRLAGLRTKRFDSLSELAALKALSLRGSNILSLEALSGLGRLVHLELKVCRSLTGLNGVEALRGLRSLTVAEGHKVHDLAPLAALEKLEVLNLSDCGELDSLAPLAGLRNLKAVAFAGARTTLRDGDLSPLLALPKLSMVMFGARRHYSHKIVKPWSWDNFDSPDRLLAPK